ncbi:hypothetical protein L195_g063908, partial [Trifolium pratense]
MSLRNFVRAEVAEVAEVADVWDLSDEVSAAVVGGRYGLGAREHDFGDI